ncbi:tripartite tricarboxylate transporter permease [Halalkalibacter alkaliphilus]|uniref:Tripartite tricarboxylate transporter permease n=1 Tax=Halalkalibacter alkaliphilus TaxID=2917993 RepID=A0A9X2I7J8_9BACI|nr:tripartite tricarboxylate transporter permease [Halalkalibacter alkaliphilus]MCL7749228.1 tripartite tricarboxylate transporter permease [Halalkalibacter alkaliphilus]
MIEQLLSGFSTVLGSSVLLMILLGTVAGYFIGSIPGLTPSIGIALLIPFTFGMEPVAALVLLVSLYVAAEYGGGITAILLNAPGTPAAAATSFDGYPLAKQGKAGKALTVSIVASAIGAFISTILLIFTAVPMANFALNFGPAEYFALALFGLSLVSSLSEGSLVKSLIAMFIGLIIVTIGMDPVNGVPRFAVTTDLLGGVPFLPALIGLFALSEVFYMLEAKQDKNNKKVNRIERFGLKDTKETLSKFKGTLIRSPILGYVIGIIPGAGVTIASLISYNEAKRSSKNRDSFGKGNPEGIAASEGANNAAVPGSLAPLLALGIPGSASAAILIGALTIQGVQPGPLLFTEYPEIPYSIFASLLLSIPLMLAVGLFGVRLWVNVTLIPKRLLAVVVAGICILGAYAYSNSMYSVWIMLIAGIVGYLFRKIGIPTTPIVLAMVLGFMMEVNFRRAMVVSDGNLLFFLSRPIAFVLIALAVLTLLVPIIRSIKSKKKEADDQNISM